MPLDQTQIADARTLQEIAQELRTDLRADRRDAVVREFIENAYTMTSATPEQMECLLERYVLDNRHEFPSLMRLHQDVANPAWEIARKCRDHMIEASRHGDNAMGLRLALGHLEELAAEIVYGTKAEWLTGV